MNKNWIVLISIFVLFSITALWWALRSEPTPPNDLGGVFHFHPDSVTTFRWKTGGEAFEFTRKTRSDPWTPQVDPYRIQTKLNILSTIAVVDDLEPNESRVDFEVEFAPGNSWTGVFDGATFVWTSGQLAGKGATFDEKNLRWFTEGKYSFAGSDWQWCPKRPKKISFESESGDDYELSQEGVVWKLKTSASGKKPEKALDPTMVENWLGKNCSDRIITSRDVKTFPLESNLTNSKSITIEYDDGTKKEFPQNGSWVVVEDGRAIEPQNFVRNLRELTSIPD